MNVKSDFELPLQETDWRRQEAEWRQQESAFKQEISRLNKCVPLLLCQCITHSHLCEGSKPCHPCRRTCMHDA
jgi:hypothetical protein